MATVYLAPDPRPNRKVAVKVMRTEVAAVIGSERFLKEIETTTNLQHPHILRLFDSGRVDCTVFYVMPYVQGVEVDGLLRGPAGAAQHRLLIAALTGPEPF